MNDRINDLFNPLRYWSSKQNMQVCIDTTDAELDREDSLSERNAFQLGQEMGVLRLTPPCDDEGQPIWPHLEMASGYAHGMRQPPKRSDVYLRKLLNLKRNAFARNIPVSSALSVDYLRNITVTVCPVSGVNLTQGAMTDTDWSVDRLDNSLGYVPGNLCMISTRVNRLKGGLEFGELQSQVISNFRTHGVKALVMDLPCGLMGLEGLRMTSLMAGPQSNSKDGKNYGSPPLAMAPGVWTTVEHFVAATHLECAQTRLENQAYRIRVKMFKRLGSRAWRTSNRLVEAIRTELNRKKHPADIWLDGDIFAQVIELIDACGSRPIPGLTDEDSAQRQRLEMESLSSYVR